MFSVSTIYSARDFLRLIGVSQLSTTDFLASFKKYQFESSIKVLQLVTECGWVHLDLDGTIKLSKKGSILADLDYKSALVKQLEDMILVYNPDWASFLPKGREETIRFLPDSPKQCFKEAGFIGEFTDELIKTWDRLALAYRNYSNQQLLETGRLGEKLSLEYEKERTGKKPVWQSIESNLSGFDILSSVDSQDDAALLIEVKATKTSLSGASFYLSKNEWRTAKTAINYILHLWALKNTPTLYVVNIESILRHIPSDNGDGKWQSVQIPFSSVLNVNSPAYIVNE